MNGSRRKPRANNRQTIETIVTDIRRRWMRRTWLRGGALALLVFLLLSFLLLLYVMMFVTSTAQLVVASVFILVVVSLVAYRFIVSPIRRQPTNAQIALFVEEKIPELEDSFNSAVEVGGKSGDTARGVIIERLLQDALSKSKIVQPATVIDRRREQWLMYVAGGLFIAFMVFGWTVRDRIDISSGRIELAGLQAEPEMTILPGNAEVERGSSQEIILRLRDETSADVAIHYREGEAEWLSEPMIIGAAADNVYLFDIQNIQEPVEYFIDIGGERTDLFSLSLYEFPAVASIQLSFTYPRYTGLPVEHESGSGDIRALAGTTVGIAIETTGAAKEASLVFSEGRAIEMQETSPGVFAARTVVQQDDWYHFELQNADGRDNKFPREYRIEAVEDAAPSVTFTDPGRDLRANAIEEVLVSAQAYDDIGLRDVKLRFSVNAADEEEISLATPSGRSTKEADGEHLFFLEDYSLQPGDVISYYAEVRDYLDRDRPVATDMYFVEVIPFDKDFAQQANAGGQQGRASGVVLSQQQIIAATWKLYRTWNELDGSEAQASLDELVQAQANLKFNIEQRISSTAFSLELRNSEEQMQTVEYLRNAIDEMGSAISVLESGDLKAAITPERRALNHLLRADAMNKQQQVSANRGNQGGGQGGVQDRISELMDLELDISKDKYETQQQGSAENEQTVDDALDKVRELAKKQEELEQQTGEQEFEGEDKKRLVDQLKRDQDDLQQQTEQLSQALRQMQNQNGDNRQMQRSAERIAENMDRAERALRDGDVEEAVKFQRRALNELEELQRSLEMDSARGAREQVQDLADNFDDFREQERRLSDDIDQAIDDARTGRLSNARATLEDLRTKRERMIENLDELVASADDVSEKIRDEDPELSKALNNILQQINRDGLKNNMEDSREGLRQGWLDYADRKEEQILRTIEDIETQRRAFDFSADPSAEETLARSLADAEDLRDQLEQIERMNSDSQPGQGEQAGGENRDQRTAEAQMRNQLDRARQTLNRLQEQMGNNPEARRQLQQLESFLTRADGTGNLLEGDEAKEYFDNSVYSPLSQLEQLLARELDMVLIEKKLYGARKTEVPAAYRDLVDRYYESLSKTNN